MANVTHWNNPTYYCLGRWWGQAPCDPGTRRFGGLLQQSVSHLCNLSSYQRGVWLWELCWYMQCTALAIRDSLWQVKAILLFPSPQTLTFDVRFSWFKLEGLGLMAKVFSAQFLSYASTVWKHCYRFRNLAQNDVIPKMSTALRTILLHAISFDVYTVSGTL